MLYLIIFFCNVSAISGNFISFTQFDKSLKMRYTNIWIELKRAYFGRKFTLLDEYRIELVYKNLNTIKKQPR